MATASSWSPLLRLRQRVGVHEAEQRLEHPRLHALDLHAAADGAAGHLLLRHGEELRLEDRGPRRQQAAVRVVRGLAADIDHDVRALLLPQQVAEVPVQVRRQQDDARRGQSGVAGAVGGVLGPVLDDGDVAPDGEAVVLEAARLLKVTPMDELLEPLAHLLAVEVVHAPGRPGVPGHGVPRRVEQGEAELDGVRPGHLPAAATVDRLEVEGDVLRPAVAVGVVGDPPPVARRVERWRRRRPVRRELPGRREPSDGQVVVPRHLARDDGGGRSGEPACGGG